MSKVINLVEADFDKALQSSEFVLVEFGADWCRPCKVLEPIIESLSEEIPHKVFKIDVDDCLTITEKYKVKSVPTVIVFKNGEVHNISKGVTSLANLKKLFE